MTIKRGTQIAYIPDHAEDDITYPDVEFGFAMNVPGHVGVACRYWRKGHPGELRMVANSEMTPLENITEYESVPQRIVDQTIKQILEAQ